MSPRQTRRKSSKPIGGGGARNPRALANLTPGAGAAGAGPGNTRALKTGVYAQIAKRDLDEKAREVYDALTVDMRESGLSTDPVFSLAIRQLAEALIRQGRCQVDMDRFGYEAKDGRLRGVAEYEARLGERIDRLMDRMGMTEVAARKLGWDKARTMDLAQHWAATAQHEAERRTDIEGEVVE